MATDSERARAWDKYVQVLLTLNDKWADAVIAADTILSYRDERFGDGNEKPFELPTAFALADGPITIGGGVNTANKTTTTCKAEEPATPEILPCPWCKGKCRVESTLQKVWVYCINNSCEVVGPTETNVADAIAAWNSICG